MANYYGTLNLSKIPEDLVQKNPKGERIVYLNVAERSENEWGYSHQLSIGIPKDKKQQYQRAIFVGNLKESKYDRGGNGGYSNHADADDNRGAYYAANRNNSAQTAAAASPASASGSSVDDLPF